MLQALVSYGYRLVNKFNQALAGKQLPTPDLPVAGPKTYGRLQRVCVTDQVCRTLFDDFEKHRRSRRGDEEIGWVLLGVREETSALVLATLPAGADRNAGVAHVRFNSDGQALASRIVRQWNKKLALLGVVHTHPGSLRHPSNGDFQGDSQWVGQLKGGEGIFGIGTADELGMQSDNSEPHRQVLGELGFSWYALGQGDKRYRKLSVEVTLGPDLAKPLHPIWEIIERHAVALDCLCRQQAKVTFEVTHEANGPVLSAKVSLADKDSFLRIALERDETRYYVQHQGMLSAVDPEEENVDRAVYLILAELANLKKPVPVRS